MVAEVRLSVNLTNRTIDAVVSKLQHSHLQLLDLALDDLRFAHAPEAALWRLEAARSEAESRDRLWFNQTKNYVHATSMARDAQLAVLRSLTNKSIWVADATRNSIATQDVASRMHAVAQLCARAGRQKEAVELLRLAQDQTSVMWQHSSTFASRSGTAIEVHRAALLLRDGERSQDLWRIEVAQQLLEQNVPEPWPATLVALATLGCADPSGCIEAISMLAKKRYHAARTEMASTILEWVVQDSDGSGRWRRRRLPPQPANGDGEPCSEMGPMMVSLRVSRGGVGAVLLEAAQHDHAAQLVQALLTRNPRDMLSPVSPSEATEEGRTALMVAARAKAHEVCRVLMRLPTVYESAYSLQSDRFDQSAFDLHFLASNPMARAQQDQLEIVRQHFNPSAVDDDLSEMASSFEEQLARDAANLERLKARQAEEHAAWERLHSQLETAAQARALEDGPPSSTTAPPDWLVSRAAELDALASSQRQRAALVEQLHRVALDRQLMLACYWSNERRVRSLLDEDADPLARSPRGCTTLMMVADSLLPQRASILAVLLRTAHARGGTDARCLASETWKSDWINAAAHSGSPARPSDAEVEWLPSAPEGAEGAELRPQQRLAALLASVTGGQTDSLSDSPHRARTAHGRVAPMAGVTALALACARGQTDVAHLLLRVTADPQMKVGPANMTPLMLCAQYGNENCMRKLLDEAPECYADVNAAGRDALMLAAMNGHDGCVRTLLEHASSLEHRQRRPSGASPAPGRLSRLLERADRNGWSALFFACHWGFDRVVQELLAVERHYSGVEGVVGRLISQADRDRCTVLMVACHHGDMVVTRALMRTLEMQCEDGQFRSAIGAAHSDLEELDLEVMAGCTADVAGFINARNRKGKSALMLAVENYRDHLTVQVLLQSEACDPNASNAEGSTPLMAAVQRGYLEETRHLLAHPAIVPTRRNAAGLTALDIAASKLVHLGLSSAVGSWAAGRRGESAPTAEPLPTLATIASKLANAMAGGRMRLWEAVERVQKWAGGRVGGASTEMLKGLGREGERAVLGALRRASEVGSEVACIKRSESEQSSFEIEVGTVESDEGLIQRYIGIVQSLENPSNAEEVAASVKSRGARRGSMAPAS